VSSWFIKVSENDPEYPRIDVYGSLDELERDFGVRPEDLHRPSLNAARQRRSKLWEGRTSGSPGFGVWSPSRSASSCAASCLFSEHGLDSQGNLELRTRIETETGIRITPQGHATHNSARDLGSHLSDALAAEQTV
jgi:hypothetical protein